MKRLALVLLCACGSIGGGSRSSSQALSPPTVLPSVWFVPGDSTTADHSSPTGGWPNEMQRVCAGCEVNNIAVPGSFVLDDGTGRPNLEAQWLSVKQGIALNSRGMLLAGGFNDIHSTSDDGPTIFARLQGIADDAVAAGWFVAFVSPLPCGGTCTEDEEGKRLVIKSLQAQWASDNGQLALDLDRSGANCGDVFNNGVQALCDFARMGDTDTVHPSRGGQVVIAGFIADRLVAQELIGLDTNP